MPPPGATPRPPESQFLTTPRESLTTRVLPKMVLSNGGLDSLTSPPDPLPEHLSASERAVERFRVKGNAVVTGGAGTLALSASRSLLEHGLTGLALLDLSLSTSNPAITSLVSDFPDAHILTLAVDITDHASVTRAMQAANDRLGSIDMLLCFAGIVSCLPSQRLEPQDWKKVIDVNLTGTWFCCQAAASFMIAAGKGGSILLVASISAHRVNWPQPQLAYNVSKASLLTLKSCLAAEWAVHGIRVNSISPGYMDTILNEGKGLKEARDSWQSRNPMGRMGLPRELTGAVVLLCSGGGSYMNGVDLVVDGGGLVF